MIKQNYPSKTANQIQRQDSYDSTTSSNGSHRFRSIYDLDPTAPTLEKSPNKFKLVQDSRIRKSVNKMHNLRLLGILKTNDKQKETKNQDELFKKVFKVTQKGLNYDNQQYFLSLNSTVMNNRLCRQASPVERLKYNLYDDERIYQGPQVQIQNNYQQDTPINSQQAQANNLLQQQAMQKKRPIFRRRSCYCNYTGKQSQKSLRIDFLFPTNLIKNRIFMRMKKKQDMMKLKGQTEKDLIIQNLNRTFDIDKNSAISSPNLNNLQNFNFLDRSPQYSGRGSLNLGSNKQNNITHLQQVQRSQFSYITSPKSGKQQLQSQNSFGGQTPSRKKQNTADETNTNKSKDGQTVKHSFGEVIQNIQKEEQQNNTPTSNNNEKSNSQSKIVHHSKDNSKTKNDLMLRSSTRRNPSSSKNSPNNRNKATPSPSKQTPNSSNKNSIFFNNTANSNPTSYFGNFLSTQTKNNNGQYDNSAKTSYEQNYPQINEKRRKLIAKLRIASKLVGIQEKQRKKSFLYHQDYYSAMQEIANNEVEQDHHEEQNHDLNTNEEKKYVLVRKTKNENKNIQSPVVLQIIDSHNLRFNSTLNNFLDSRSKSYNNLIPNSNLSMSNIAGMNNKKRINMVSPFKNNDVYLQPLPVYSPSPSKKSPNKYKNKAQQSLILQDSNYQKSKNGNKSRRLNESDHNQSVFNKTQYNSLCKTELDWKTGYNKLVKNPKQNSKLQSSMNCLLSTTTNGWKNKSQANISQGSLKDIVQIEGLNQVNQNHDNQFKSSKDILSIDQIGRYESYYSKNQKMSTTLTNLKSSSKAKQKLDLIMNSQNLIQNSKIFKNQNLIKNPQIFSNNKSINQYHFNSRNSSQPDLFQSNQSEQSQNNSMVGNKFFIPQKQTLLNNAQSKQQQQQQLQKQQIPSIKSNYQSSKLDK